MKALFISGIFSLVAVIAVSSPTTAQSFSCSMGKRAACLDYGDKVVDQNAQCFNSYTCDFNGFMCRSDHDDYVKKAKKLLSTYEDLKNCVSTASSIEAAKACNLYY